MIPWLVPAAILATLVAVVAVCGRRQQAAFEAKFPPISDAEFLARCRPGTSREVALKVRRLVSERLGIEYDRIYPESRFVDDLGAD